jgi:Complex1_LYR-like
MTARLQDSWTSWCRVRSDVLRSFSNAHNNGSFGRIHLQTSLQFEGSSGGSSPPNPVRNQHAARILPDLDFFRLYRRILRVHRHLPLEMRSLGDDYVKAGSCSLVACSKPSPLTRTLAPLEFRRHKDVTNPAYIIGFLSQWKVYLDQIPVGPEGQRFRGKKLDPTMFEKVRRKHFLVRRRFMSGHAFSFLKNSWVRCTSLCGPRRTFGSRGHST